MLTSLRIEGVDNKKEINHIFLAGLFEKYLDDENLKLYGNVLSIHDWYDKFSITPALYFQRSEGLGKFMRGPIGCGTLIAGTLFSNRPSSSRKF